MGNDNRKPASSQTGGVDAGTLDALIRQRVRETIEAVVAAELELAFGAARSHRVGGARQGYRHGTRPRTVTTSVGPTVLTIPRGRVRTATRHHGVAEPDAATLTAPHGCESMERFSACT